ncbi:MAG: CoA transferase, partial [Thermoleophilaceae bacterium]|nr:CoA transferase [Thermoleophilaceae bacterium]
VAMAMVGNLGKIAEAQVSKHERQKDGNYLYGAFGRDFITQDGRRIMVVALTLKQWKSLVKATGLHEGFETLEKMMGVDLTKEGDRFVAREVIGAMLKPWMGAHTVDEIRVIFDVHDVCWGPYQTFMELVEEDPRCSAENPMFEELEQPGIGTYLMPGSPLEFGGVERLPVRRAPLLGEHTEEILADVIGLSPTEIGRLHDDGVVAGPVAATA